MSELLKHWLYKIFSPGRLLRRRYAAFKELLHHDLLSQQHMAQLESFYYDQQKVDFCRIAGQFDKLCETVAAVIKHLGVLTPRDGIRLRKQYNEIVRTARRQISDAPRAADPPYVLPLDRITPDQAGLAGDKATRLARIMTTLNLPVPAGFVITTNAFHHFCAFNRLRPEIEARLRTIDIHSAPSLEDISAELIALVNAAEIPPEVEEALREVSKTISLGSLEPMQFAVRSSAAAEDSVTSFAGQYQTVLNVPGHGLANAYKQVLASKYTPKALCYRIHHGLSDAETAMAVLVLEMIPAAASGILYTRNPTDPAAPEMHLYSVWGLGELLVSGEASPDIITLARDGRSAPKVRAIQPGTEEFKKVTAQWEGISKMPLNDNERSTPSLDRDSAERLGAWGLELERLFEHPQDIEWCRDTSGTIHILQSRPLQFNPPNDETDRCLLAEFSHAIRLAGGEKAASGIGVGQVVKVSSAADLSGIPKGSVLVTHNTPPELARAIDKLAAVVADVGSSAGHFASVAREFGIPTLVNTRTATRVLEEGEWVTVLADRKLVLAGRVKGGMNSARTQIARPDASPLTLKLNALLSHISPLNLVEPGTNSFTPKACRTLHDILRFAHEKSIQEMFSLAGNDIRPLKRAVKFRSDIPILLYLVDLGFGLEHTLEARQEVGIEHIHNIPLLAVWKGLSHPDIYWSEKVRHFDWEAFDRMSGGIISQESPQFSSYALVSGDYLNLNLRFGYHFVVVDTLCGPAHDANYISFRFKGGGGTMRNKMLRLKFMEKILTAREFIVHLEQDLIEAHLRRAGPALIEDRLEWIGRLLGCTRLLDVALDDEETVSVLADRFLDGDYRFGPLAEAALTNDP